MELITKTLYWISTGLMIPIIIMLLLFFVQSIFQVGTFYGMYVKKNKFNYQLKKIIGEINIDNVFELLNQNSLASKLPFVEYLKMIMNSNNNALYREKIINDYEIYCQADLSKSQNLAKLGPVLGLMGTLIPMGPALVGLASGDISSMASNMQVAFSTTVIGLFVGAIGYVIFQVKKRWYAADISNLEYVVDILKDVSKK